MKKLVIFDLDGTLLNTLNDLADSVNYALTYYGMPVRTVEEVRSFVGNGIGMLIKRAVPYYTDEAVIQEVLETFKVYYSSHCMDKTAPYVGMPEALKMLKDNGLRLAVVSNKIDHEVVRLVNHFFPDTFDEVVGERENVRRKPEPDSVNQVLSSLSIGRDEAVYVGDSDVDIATAANASMDSILVSWGFKGRTALESYGAKVIVDVPREIPYVLLEQNVQ